MEFGLDWCVFYVLSFRHETAERGRYLAFYCTLEEWFEGVHEF